MKERFPSHVTNPDPRPPIRFRGQSFIAFVLVPEPPVEEWLEHLDALTQKSPGFFVGRPVILDVSRLTFEKPDLAALIARLQERDIRILGLEGAAPALLGPDMPPPLAGGRPTGELEIPADKLARPEPGARTTPSLVIDKPVRSGQSITFPEGDVTVLGSVSSGAEVIAGGSIHVYGALRGRALAGSAGNPGARIYCRKLEAELLAIDSVYRTADEVENDLRGRSVQAWIQNDTIAVAALD
jgi:septum site-determining protein MinC